MRSWPAARSLPRATGEQPQPRQRRAQTSTARKNLTVESAHGAFLDAPRCKTSRWCNWRTWPATASRAASLTREGHPGLGGLAATVGAGEQNGVLAGALRVLEADAGE